MEVEVGIKLDIKNNELIFSKVDDLEKFREDLKSMKKVKVREYGGRFYISLADLQSVREVLSPIYGRRLSFTYSYQKFADRFILPKGEVRIQWDPAMCTITGSGLPWHDIIPLTSYFDKGAKRSQRYGKTWSGYHHLFDPIRGTFPSGLLERIVSALVKNNVKFHIDQTFAYPKPYLALQTAFPFEPTQDQIDSVEALDKANNGIGKLPTGFGKTSYVASALIAKKGVRSLFLANQRVLTDDALNDFQEVFKDNDIKIGLIGDGVFDPQEITVASIQSIAAAMKPPTIKERHLVQYELELATARMERLDDPDKIKEAEMEFKRHKNRLKKIDARRERHQQLLPFLKEVDLFIVDEAQVLGTDQWNSFLHACPAPYRYTLSATPTRTDGGGIQIIAATGEMRYESAASEQIEKGRLSEFMGHFRKFDHKLDKNLIKELKMDHHQAYDLFIVHNELRNDHLCNKAMEWAQDNFVLCLVTRKAHGEIIKRMMIRKGIAEDKIHFIDGDTPKKKRRDIITDFRDGKFPILIGTSVFDVGFNAKNASKMVRFNAGSSEVREPQRAGRTVRKREDNSIGETYDMLDINVPFFETQGWNRLRLLREEFGKERVTLYKEIVEGEMNIVALEEIVAAIPDETDRQKGEEIIKSLQFIDKEFEADDSYDSLEDLEPDLKKALSELSFE